MSGSWWRCLTEFLLSYFKSWKMMLWKCSHQYASKFGKLNSGHGTEKGQFSSQSPKKAMPKNVQTATQLHSSHMLASNAQKSPSQASTVCELLPGASKGDPTHDKVMRRGLMGKASQASGIPPGFSWTSTLQNQNLPALLCYAFHLLFWH